jgi:hypothetical protein
VNYNDYEECLSKPRLDKYKHACGGNEFQALELYMLNIETSKKFWGALCLFEVVLRNAINKHYKKHFNDDDWIIGQINGNFFPEDKKMTIRKEKENLSPLKPYSSDRLVAVLSFGFWVSMFSSHCFNQGNQSLLKIFPNKEKGVNQKLVFNELKEIRDFRNRIAHHEAICFNRSGEISDRYMQKIWEIILKYTHFLGLPANFLQSVESPVADMKKLREFFSLTVQG